MSTKPDEYCAARTSFGTAMTLCGEGLKSGFYLNKGILPRLMKGASGKNVVPSIINDFIQLTELWLLTSGLQCRKIWLQKQFFILSLFQVLEHTCSPNFWTPSRRCMAFFSNGSQTALAYSKFGWMKELYNFCRVLAVECMYKLQYKRPILLHTVVM